MKLKVKRLTGPMKLKDGKCGECGAIPTTIWNIEKYHICGKCISFTESEKSSILTLYSGGERHIIFQTDSKHLQADLQGIKKS